MAEMPPTEWARPPRSLAVEANDCFMVRIPRGSNRIQGRGAMLRAEWQAPLGWFSRYSLIQSAAGCPQGDAPDSSTIDRRRPVDSPQSSKLKDQKNAMNPHSALDSKSPIQAQEGE